MAQAVTATHNRGNAHNSAALIPHSTGGQSSCELDVGPMDLSKHRVACCTLLLGLARRSTFTMKKALFLFAICLHATTFAGFDEGLRAYDSGNFFEALRNWQPLAERGDANAQFNLGLIYENGRGVNVDYVQALHWYERAAGHGHVNAQNNLGGLYYRGQGAQQDYEQALYWYRKAAAGGSASAQFNLGFMYGAGHGVAQSDELAVHWYQRAADGGNAQAQRMLSRLYAIGCGVAQDAQLSAMWYRKAAQSGMAESQTDTVLPDCGDPAYAKPSPIAVAAASKPPTAAMRQVTATRLLDD